MGPGSLMGSDAVSGLHGKPLDSRTLAQSVGCEATIEKAFRSIFMQLVCSSHILIAAERGDTDCVSRGSRKWLHGYTSSQALFSKILLLLSTGKKDLGSSVCKFLLCLPGSSLGTLKHACLSP